MKNTQCVFLSTRMVCFALFPLYVIPLHPLGSSVHPDCVFFIVSAIWYTFASLNPGGQKNTSDAKVYHIEGTMQNTQSGWTEKHKWCKGISYRGNNAKHTIRCSFYMIYLCITCVFLSTRIVCFALFLLYDIPLHHLWFSVHPDCVFCIVPLSYRGNNAKHTIRMDRKTQVMQRYII
jgi:hypothetical protein